MSTTTTYDKIEQVLTAYLESLLEEIAEEGEEYDGPYNPDEIAITLGEMSNRGDLGIWDVFADLEMNGGFTFRELRELMHIIVERAKQL
jgi:hypothetical protein